MTRPIVGVSHRPDLPLAVIVGAGGMGMAIARRLGQSYRLLIADRDEAALGRQAGALTDQGYDVRVQRCDVTSAGDVAALAERSDQLGPFKALANVVGLSPSMGDFDTIMSVNIVGAARIAETFLSRATPGTCGVFISSMAAHMQPTPTNVRELLDAPLQPGVLHALRDILRDEATPHMAYLISKAALNRMCRRRAMAWGQKGARILSLSPGLIATPMGALEFERQPIKYDLLDKTPIKREGTMHEIANLVEFVVSEKASFLSGTDILIDGGLVGTLQDDV